MPLQAAHDLSNCLTPLAGYVNMAREHPACPPQIREWLDRAHDSSEECFKLINIIKGIAEAGNEVVEPHQFEICAIAMRVHREFEPHLLKLGIVSSLDLAPVPLMVMGDGFAAFRAIQNLVMNGRDAVIRSGRADNGGGRLAIATGKDSSHAFISVSDNGTGFGGMLPESEGQDESPRPQSEHGLGLRVVRRCMDLLGGTFDCISYMGKGSRFILRLPLIPVLLANTRPIARDAPLHSGNSHSDDQPLALTPTSAKPPESLPEA
jgi:signal transduction histidine kinase